MKGLFGSDSEDEQLGQLDGGTNKSEAGATMQDLFGSDDEDLQPGPSGAANAEPEYRRQRYAQGTWYSKLHNRN